MNPHVEDETCTHIYQRKNTKKNIAKGDKCKNPAVKSSYAKVTNGHFCRQHAQNEYKKKNNGIKVVKAKRVGKRGSRVVTRSQTRKKKTVTLQNNNINNTVILNNNNNAAQLVEEEHPGADLPMDNTCETPRKAARGTITVAQKDRALIVQMHSNLSMSAHALQQALDAMYKVGKFSEPLSMNTIIRETCAEAVMCDHLCAELLSISSVLGIGFDEASKFDSRSHIEIEIFGVFNKPNHWYAKKRVILQPFQFIKKK